MLNLSLSKLGFLEAPKKILHWSKAQKKVWPNLWEGGGPGGKGGWVVWDPPPLEWCRVVKRSPGAGAVPFWQKTYERGHPEVREGSAISRSGPCLSRLRNRGHASASCCPNASDHGRLCGATASRSGQPEAAAAAVAGHSMRGRRMAKGIVEAGTRKWRVRGVRPPLTGSVDEAGQERVTIEREGEGPKGGGEEEMVCALSTRLYIVKASGKGPGLYIGGIALQHSLVRGGVFAQRAHSANYYGDYPGNNPENHPPAESCTINSKLKNSNI